MLSNSQTDDIRKDQIEHARLMAQDDDGVTDGRSAILHVKKTATRVTFTPEQANRQPGSGTTGYASRPRPDFNNDGKTEFKAKGHDAVLKAVQERGTPCRVKVPDDDAVEGKVIARDRYTISVLVDGESDARIFYKAHIVYFQPMRNKVAD